VSKSDHVLAEMRNNPVGVRFADLRRLCEERFGSPRQRGTNHLVFKTPWPGDPRVNIQEGKGGKAKAHQVRQVLAAVDKLDAAGKEKEE
jgi:hypothetical protein